jgi:anti-anti-sigma factor
MSETPFTAAVRTKNGFVVVDLGGDIDRNAAVGLDEAYQTAADYDGHLILNFEGVGYINSTGIALIVGLLAKARSASREVSAYGLTDHYRQIFEITRLADFMQIYDEETAAVSAAT